MQIGPNDNGVDFCFSPHLLLLSQSWVERKVEVINGEKTIVSLAQFCILKDFNTEDYDLGIFLELPLFLEIW